MRELLGGESDDGGSAALPGGASGGDQPSTAVPAGDEPAATAEGASTRERRSGKDSKERRRDKCGFSPVSAQPHMMQHALLGAECCFRCMYHELQELHCVTRPRA